MKKNYTIKQLIPPPWLMYPHLRRFSLGWRMGSGEGYMIDFDIF